MVVSQCSVITFLCLITLFPGRVEYFEVLPRHQARHHLVLPLPQELLQPPPTLLQIRRRENSSSHSLKYQLPQAKAITVHFQTLT